MSSFLEAITSIQAPFNMVVLVVLIGCGAGVITTIASEIRKYMCHREDADLKRDMLARGMSPSEIEQVVEAKSPPRESSKNSERMFA